MFYHANEKSESKHERLFYGSKIAKNLKSVSVWKTTFSPVAWAWTLQVVAVVHKSFLANRNVKNVKFVIAIVRGSDVVTHIQITG